MESSRIKLGTAMAVTAGLMELAGGVLFTAGLLTPSASALIAEQRCPAQLPSFMYPTASGLH